jgi:hypothetical protein
MGKMLYPNPVLICSLTRAAAAEVAGRDLPLPKSAIGTLHAHCFRALEFPKLLEGSHVEEWNASSGYPLGKSDFGGGDDTSGEENAWDRRADVNIETDGDALLQRMEILRHKRVPRDDWDDDVARFADEWDAFKQEQGVIDFTDLIENALNTVYHAPGNPAVIMVDEAQDLSALEYALIQKWGKQAKATIVVGDPWQALYTWRGADPSLFSDPSVPATHRRILSQSYRVPERVLRVAVGWVRDHLSTYEPIEYAPRKEAIADEDVRGEMGWREGTIYDTDPLVDECEQLLKTGRSVMFQTSCSYMLNSLIGNLRRKHIPFSNPWRKYRRDWNPLGQSGKGLSMLARLLAFVRPCHDNPNKAPWTIKDVAKFVGPMSAKGVLRRGAKKRIEGLGEADEGDEPGELFMGDNPLTDKGDDPFGDDDAPAMSKEERDSATVLEEEIEDWFEDAVHAELRAVWAGERSVAEAAQWWQGRLLATPKKVVEYPVGVISRGLEGLVEAPRVFVGTIHCSPPDEPILTTSGYVPIGEIDSSIHRLVSFNPSCNDITRGRNAPGDTGAGYAFRKGHSQFDGQLVVVQAGFARCRVTPTHRMRVRFAESFYNKFVVYLMRRGGWWRIGMCSAAVGGGVKGRLSTERGHAAWIIGVYDTREQASMHESYYQARYGIPSLRFEGSRGQLLNSDQLQAVHSRLMESSGSNALRLLADLGLFIDAPLYSRDGVVQKRNRYWFETIAANLIDGMMEVPVVESEFPRGKEAPNAVLATITREPYSGTVFSLSVDPHEHYVSGRIVVHNSFKGAEADCTFIFPDLSAAGSRQWNSGPGPLRDEVVRLFYVAMTRARERAFICRNATKECAPLHRFVQKFEEGD